jgi:hypothetical protein
VAQVVDQRTQFLLIQMGEFHAAPVHGADLAGCEGVRPDLEQQLLVISGELEDGAGAFGPPQREGLAVHAKRGGAAMRQLLHLRQGERVAP